MSSFPPPPGGPGGPENPPPWQGTPTPSDGGFGAPPPPAGFGTPGAGDVPVVPVGGPVPGAAPPNNNKRTIGIIAAFVVAAGAAGGVTYFVTRSDDKKVATPDISVTIPSITVPDITVTVPSVSIPETTVPSATTEPPATTDAATTTTEAATTTTEVPASTIPAGAIDLGHGLFVPLPTGWTQQTPTDPTSKVVTLSDGTSSLAVQVLVRTPGEDPKAFVQEYADTFGTTFESVSFGPTRFIKQIADPAGTPVDEYSTYYVTYDSTDPDGVGLNGVINSYIRGDGLSMVYDLFGPDNGTGFPDDASAQLLNSMSTAPSLGTPVTLTPAPDFRVATPNYPVVDVDGSVMFTAAPGFNTVSSGGGTGYVTNGTEDFVVAKISGQASADAALETAKGFLNGNYTGLTFGPPNTVPADSNGIIQEGVGWTGTYVAGNASAGSVDIFFDPATGNAIVVSSDWFTGADTSEPAGPQAAFMFRSVYNSFNTIP